MKDEKENFVVPPVENVVFVNKVPLDCKFANNYINLDKDSSSARMVVDIVNNKDFFHIENCAIISLRYFKRLLIKNEEYEKVKYVNELIKNARANK